MDPIVSLALVGTARQPGAEPTTGLPTDELISELPAGDVERRLLLSAGAWAIYRQAGLKAQRIETLPEPAPAETLPECSVRVALTFSRLLESRQYILLYELLAYIHLEGQRLPFHLLPTLLNRREKELHNLAFPVLGERGVWLSRFHSAWKWVSDQIPVSERPWPAEAEQIWQEGKADQRVEIVTQLREHDPERAREWVEQAWSREKASLRVRLLDVLATHLSLADEPFLERALDDRSAEVVAQAALLLTSLPASKLVTRMQERARASFELVDGKLTVHPPDVFAADWARDGLIEKSPQKLDKQVWWLLQILGCIPLTYWETAFASPLEPTELLTLVTEHTWATSVVEGWSRAAIVYKTSSWQKVLWDWWLVYEDRIHEEPFDDRLRYKLFASMAGADAEEAFLALVERADPFLDAFMFMWPRPWSERVGRTFLRECRAHYLDQPPGEKDFHPQSNFWFQKFKWAASALPRECFVEALEPWDFLFEASKRELIYARQMLKEFVETIQERQKMYEEIV